MSTYMYKVVVTNDRLGMPVDVHGFVVEARTPEQALSLAKREARSEASRHARATNARGADVVTYTLWNETSGRRVATGEVIL